jgi:hypothetical protein
VRWQDLPNRPRMTIKFHTHNHLPGMKGNHDIRDVFQTRGIISRLWSCVPELFVYVADDWNLHTKPWRLFANYGPACFTASCLAYNFTGRLCALCPVLSGSWDHLWSLEVKGCPPNQILNPPELLEGIFVVINFEILVIINFEMLVIVYFEIWPLLMLKFW